MGVEPRPLEFVSPTSAEQLRKCGLALAFRRDLRFSPAERPTPGAALGTVAHAVLELVGTGAVDDVPEDGLRGRLEELWATEVAKRSVEFETAESLTAPPPPEEWPRYFLVRSRVIRRAADIATRRRVPARNGPSTDGLKVAVEGELRAGGGLLRGRPDRVETSSDGIVVVDLKTGALDDDVKPEHRRQLLFYAALVQRDRGVWPTRAAIEGVDGRRRSIDVDPGEAEAVVDEALALLRRFNEATADGTTDGLAAPSADSCRFCAFAGACPAFLGAVDPSWDMPGVAFSGLVDSVSSHDGVGVVTVSGTTGAVQGGTARLLGVPAPLLPSLGSWVSVVRAVTTAGQRDFRSRWETQLWLWDEPSDHS